MTLGDFHFNSVILSGFVWYWDKVKKLEGGRVGGYHLFESFLGITLPYEHSIILLFYMLHD